MVIGTNNLCRATLGRRGSGRALCVSERQGWTSRETLWADEEEPQLPELREAEGAVLSDGEQPVPRDSHV